MTIINIMNTKFYLSDILLTKETKRKRDNEDMSESEERKSPQPDNKDIYSEDNHIYFKSSVTNKSISELITIINKKNKEIQELKKKPLVENIIPKPLYLHITSFGGSLLAGFRAVDVIKRSAIPIYTIVDGHAASAGTLMSVVGAKRYMTPHSYMLIHQLSTSTMGKFWEIQDDFKNFQQMMDDIYDIYISHSTLNKRQLKDYLKHDLWWKVDKCIEVGLVDEIYDSEE